MIEPLNLNVSGKVQHLALTDDARFIAFATPNLFAVYDRKFKDYPIYEAQNRDKMVTGLRADQGLLEVQRGAEKPEILNLIKIASSKRPKKPKAKAVGAAA